MVIPYSRPFFTITIATAESFIVSHIDAVTTMEIPKDIAAILAKLGKEDEGRLDD